MVDVARKMLGRAGRREGSRDREQSDAAALFGEFKQVLSLV